MKAVKLITWLVMMFIELMYFFIIACTIALTVYTFVSIIYFLMDLFKLPPDNTQPETSVGLQFEGN